MKKALLVIGMLLWALPALAQSGSKYDIPLAVIYDADATDFTYCSMVSELGSDSLSAVWGEGILERRRITTSGSSTTVTSVGSAGSFTSVAVGDVLIVPLSGKSVERVVTARASANSITVDTAINIGDVNSDGLPFRWRDFSCGTTVTSGWIPVKHLETVYLTFQLEQGVFSAGGVSARWECKNEGVGAAPVSLHAPAAYTTAGIASRTTLTIVENAYAYCRVGFAISDTDDGDDLTTNAEQVTIRAVGIPRK